MPAACPRDKCRAAAIPTASTSTSLSHLEQLSGEELAAMASILLEALGDLQDLPPSSRWPYTWPPLSPAGRKESVGSRTYWGGPRTGQPGGLLLSGLVCPALAKQTCLCVQPRLAVQRLQTVGPSARSPACASRIHQLMAMSSRH